MFAQISSLLLHVRSPVGIRVDPAAQGQQWLFVIVTGVGHTGDPHGYSAMVRWWWEVATRAWWRQPAEVRVWGLYAFCYTAV